MSKPVDVRNKLADKALELFNANGYEWKSTTTSLRLTVKAGKAICSTMPGSVLEPGIAMLIIVSF